MNSMRWLWPAAVVLIAGCCRPTRSATLRARVADDRSVIVEVEGPIGHLVTVAAKRPWQGEDRCYGGLPGLRTIPPDGPSDPGQILSTVFGAAPLRHHLSAAQVAALPSPAVLQAVVLKHGEGAGIWLTEALWLEHDADGTRIEPFTTRRGLGRALLPLLTWVGLPLIGALLLRRRWRRPPAAAALGALLLAAVVARVTATPASWPWSTWPPPDPLTTLSKHFGIDLPALTAAVHAARVGDEPLTLAFQDNVRAEVLPLALQLAQQWSRCRLTTNASELPAGGLVLELVGCPASGPPTTPVAPMAPTDAAALFTTSAGTLWRLRGR